MSALALVAFLVLGAVLVAAVLRWRGHRRATRRERLRRKPFPPAWREMLERDFPLYRGLSPEERERLHGHVHVFLAEKSFEGCGGLEMTDEIRVLIAAQACLLLLNLEAADYYPSLRSILVYPSTMVPVYAHEPTHGTVAGEPHPVLGQSWGHGTVILSWDSVRRGVAAVDDGKNVVFHEFAHQLDQEEGEADGVPPLESASAFLAWGRVMREHFEALQEAAEEGRPTVLDDYGAVNPAEFFAVATESFIEKPVQLQKKHPELYRELADYYGLDPASWHS